MPKPRPAGPDRSLVCWVRSFFFALLTGSQATIRHPQFNLGEIIDADHSCTPLDSMLPLRRLRLFSQSAESGSPSVGNFPWLRRSAETGFALADDKASGSRSPLIGAVPIADVRVGTDLSLNFRRCFRHEGSDQNRDDPWHSHRLYNTAAKRGALSEPCLRPRA